jgi:hypothetical protein
LVIFAGFIWYAHSGWYLVDTSKPLTPLRRDDRGKMIRDRAVIVAVVVGGLVYALLGLTGWLIGSPISGGAFGFLAGVVIYFILSSYMYIRN